MGRGLLADHDAPLLGTYMGVAGLPEVTQRVEGSDGLFLLGEIICDTNFAVSETRIDMRKTIQALDGRVTMGYQVYPDLPLAVLVDALLESLGPEVKAFAVKPATYPHGMVADTASITPTDIATAVNDLMAAHGKMPIASDMGDCLFTAMEIEHTAQMCIRDRGQIGNPDGDDKPNKKYYDPRAWIRKGEETFKARLKQAFADLNNIGTLA